jgi:chloramphenicol-sensitive protein RarD
MERENNRVGYLYALSAHTLWGLLPFYWRTLSDVPSLEVIAHRVVWSLLFLAAICLMHRSFGDIFRVFRSPAALITLMTTGALIASNWLVYVWAVTHGHIIEASLGYFISPLFTIALGALLLKESLTRYQRGAILLASAAVIYRVVVEGIFPWIGIALAVSLSMYSFLRKRLPVSSLIGLSVETLLLLPIALGYLSIGVARGTSHFTAAHPSTMGLLALTGVCTSLPLLCFVRAAQLLPLSTMGILQYMSPSLQFLSALLFFGESLSLTTLVSFSFIWLAIVLYLAGDRINRGGRNQLGAER